MTRRTAALLWCSAGLLATAAAMHGAGRYRALLATAPVPPAGDAGGARRWAAPDARGEWASGTVAANPFRSTRDAAPLPFGSVAPVVLDAPPAPVQITVTGVAGPPWAAIVQGLPSRPQGMVLRPGQRVAGIEVVHISQAGVRLRSADSVWTVGVRRLP